MFRRYAFAKKFVMSLVFNIPYDVLVLSCYRFRYVFYKKVGRIVKKYLVLNRNANFRLFVETSLYNLTMAIEFESTYAKAKRDDEGYRKSISTIPTWGEKLHLLTSAPDLCSLYYSCGDTLLINIHGGGFCYKHPLDDDALCKYISQTYCVSVLNVDFSSSVKWGYPVQLIEIDRQINAFLLEHPMRRIILQGHSSGANLAASLLERWIKNKTHEVTALVLNYPILDLSIEAKDRPQIEGLWPDELYDDWIRFYAPNRINRKDHSISPLYMPKSIAKEFPSTYIVSCEIDRIKDDAVRFTNLLKESRVETRHYISSERHGFIERNMKDVYHLPNDPNVRYAKTIVDQAIVFALTAAN